MKNLMKLLKKVEATVSRFIAVVIFLVYSFGLFPLYAVELSGVVPFELVNTVELVSKVVDEKGGVLETAGVRFIIPEGALTEATEIKISRLFRVEEGGEVKNVTEGAGGYRFEPKGQKFKKFCTVEMQYDGSLSKDNLDELYTYYFNEKVKAWEVLERVGINEEKRTVVSLTNHFTDMINGTLTLPEHPDPVSVNLNSIKELKAADVAGGIEKIEGLEGTSEGNAGFNFGFILPQGTGGLTPQLGVSYSSGGGVGIVGKGFNLQGIESISIDTRHGLPKYNGSDTYIINGSLCQYSGGKWEVKRETSYSRIKNAWIEGGGQDENYFVIKEKTGITKVYGKTAWSGASADKKYIYYLDSVTDGFGNVITYKYSENKKEVRLESISYGKDGAQRIALKYDKREDVRLDGRGKYVKRDSGLLHSVTTYSAGEAVRSYIFGYEPNVFRENYLTSISVVPGKASGSLDSLTEKQRELIYTYKFSYEEPEYEGRNLVVFGETQKWWKKGSISESVSTSYGGSYGGGGGVSIDGISITAGINGYTGEGQGFSKRNFVDITGDGVAEIVEWTSSGVKVYAQQKAENGVISYLPIKYDTDSLKGLKIDKNSSSNWSVGGDLNIKMLAGNFGLSGTKQHSLSETKSGFFDVNGDGFVDFVADGQYYLNNGKGFGEKQSFSNLGKRNLDISEEEKRESERAAYLQEGIKAWRAERSGLVEIKVNVKSKDNGIKLLVFNGEGTTSILECNEIKPYTKEIFVNKGGYIYFVTETDKGVMVGSKIEASITIEYKSYTYFEDLQTKVKYIKPQDSYNSMAEVPKVFKSLYGKQETGVALRDGFEKELENILKGDNAEIAIRQLIRDKRYDYKKVHIAKDIFEKAFTGLNEEEKRVVQRETKYDENFKEYLLIDETPVVGNGESVKKNAWDIIFSKLNVNEIEKIFGYDFDGKVVQPQYEWSEKIEFIKRYLVEGKELYKVVEREKEHAGYEDTEGINLGIINGEKFYIRKGKEKLEVSINGKDSEDIFVDYEEDKGKNIKIKYIRKEKAGYDVIIQADGRHLGDTITENEYKRLVKEKIAAEREYRINTFEKISEDVYKLLEKDLKSLYEKDSSDFYVLSDGKLRENFSNEEKELQKKIEQLKESLISFLLNKKHDKLYVSKEGNIRQLLFFTEAEVADIGQAYFEEVKVGNTKAYQISGTLSEELLQRLKEYETYLYDFPYFIHDTVKKEYRVDKKKIAAIENVSGNDEDKRIAHEKREGIRKEIEGYLTYLNAYYYSSIDAKIIYYDDGLFPVQDGMVEIAKFTDTGITREQRPIKSIYSGEENKKAYTTVKSEYTTRYEKLYGGLNWWYYGLYTRYPDNASGKYRDFDPKTLFTDMDKSGKKYKDKADIEREAQDKQKSINNKQGENEKLTQEEKNKVDETVSEQLKNEPQSYISVAPFIEVVTDENSKAGESIRIPKDTYKNYTLVGPIASNPYTKFNKDGELVSGINYYAAYIDGEFFYTCRSGGDSYSKSPWNTGAGIGFVVGASKSESSDITVSAGVGVNGNISYNTGWGQQTDAYMDINGDGIPDIISGGKTSINVQALTKEQSIIDNKDYKNIGLSYSTNSSDTNGAGMSGSGSISKELSTNGKVKSISVNANLGGGVNSSIGTQAQLSGLIDINGDGLPDFANFQNKGKELVNLNIGDEFTPEGDWEAENINSGSISSNGSSINVGGAGDTPKPGTTTVSVGVSCGVNYSISRNTTERMLMDINGDGLPDKVSIEDGSLSVEINTGDKFLSIGKNISIEQIVPLDIYQKGFKAITDVVDRQKDTIKVPYKSDNMGTSKFPELDIPNALEFNTSATVGLSGSLRVNIGIPVWDPPKISVLINASGGGSGSYTNSEVSLRFFDIDGDGLADRVFNVSGTDELYVQLNKLGKVGLLKKITLPTGGEYELRYKREGNTVKMPQSRYVLSEVTQKSMLSYTQPISLGELDNIVNIQEYTVRYRYNDGYYDRGYKDFLGFGEVIRKTEGGKEIITKYYNDAYYRKGMRQKIVVQHKGNEYQISECEVDVAPYARVVKETVTQKEYSSIGSGEIRSCKRYGYDKFGNINEFTDEGIAGDASDDVAAFISYRAVDEKYFASLPTEIEVRDRAGKVLRKRECSYDGNTGAIKVLREYYESAQYLESSITWTAEGSISSISSPTGKKIAYEYDRTLGIYPVKISEIGKSGNLLYAGLLEWDLKLGVKLQETDASGNRIRYSYDDFGRITEVRSDYDTGTIPYAKYEYFTPEDGFWYSITENKIVTDGTNNGVMRTAFLHDGLGRVAYMAKEGEVAQDNNSTATKKGWNISGTVYYDNEGKKVLEGQPVFYSGNLIAELDKDRESQVLVYKKFNNLQNPTGFIYDGIGRNIKTILPDENIQTSEYGIKNNFSIIKTTDPLGNKSVTKKDVHGNIREVERLDKDENLLTKARYEYSLLGEMLKAYDAKGNIISVNYDLLGRRISLESLDMGRKEWNYDAKGLLASETDSVLRAKQAAIKYEYDELDRIVKIDYPFSVDTCYEYGKAGEAGAGEIVHKMDETGETFYRYGKLNEVTEETRTIKRGRDGVQKPITSSFSYEVDYLGRMQTITYPDGEVVRYTYDAGGQLNGVSGKKAGTEYRYVDSILYNEQGQRVYIRYGNGVETRYKYDPARRWLDSIKTVNKDKNLSFQNIKYNFDAVGNVKGYENTASTYATSQSYTYDNLYQLVKAEGTTKAYAGVNPVPENPGSVLSTNKYRQTFGFDDIGNMMSKVSTTNIAGGSSAGKNDASLNYNIDYEYDVQYAHRLKRAGERYYKYDANGNLIAEKDGAFEAEDDFTFKYSYFEDLDVYGVDYGFDLAPPEKDPANLADTGTQAGKKSGYRRDYEWNERNLLSRSRDSEKTVTYRYGDDGERALKFCQQTNSETLYFNNFYSMQQVAHEPNHEQGLRVSKHIFVGNSRLVTALTHQAGIDTTEQAAKLYYYHADHLQSAQFITNARGEQYEHIEYTPYGELWIEETAPGVDKLPFRFTGKELDEETGLYYYGARYLDPKYSRWLSGDPAVGEYIPQAGADTSKLPNGGVYNSFNFAVFGYGNNNPVKYNDPTGRISMPASADFEEAMSIATVGVGVALPAAPAIPYFKGGLATLGKALSVIGIVVFVALLQGDVAKSSAKESRQAEKKNPETNQLIIQIQGPDISGNERKGSRHGSHQRTVQHLEPTTRIEAQTMLRSLMGELSDEELNLMAPAIIAASKFIEKSANGGGVVGNGSRSYKADDNGNRVDIIWNGKENLVP